MPGLLDLPVSAVERVLNACPTVLGGLGSTNRILRRIATNVLIRRCIVTETTNHALVVAAGLGLHGQIPDLLSRTDPATHEYALSCAAQRGHLEATKILVEVVGRKGLHSEYCSALRNAAFKGHVEILRVLLDAGAPDKDVALCCAAQEGQAEAVVLLLAAGADVNASKNYPLMKAAANSHMVVVKILLAATGYGADGSLPELTMIRTRRADIAKLLRAAAKVQAGYVSG